MNCPFCGAEMESGKLIIDGRSYPLWQPESRKYDMLDRIMGTDGKELHGIRISAWSRGKIEAYHCPACRKFIFDAWVDKY